MNNGIIYLIQPAELVGTSRYKIGCSGKTDLNRCKNGYKKGSRYLCIMECVNPVLLENKIKNIFSDKFKLIAGKEYYEGNEIDMYNLFIQIVSDYKNNLSNKINNNHCDVSNPKNKNSEVDNILNREDKITKIINIDHFCQKCNIKYQSNVGLWKHNKTKHPIEKNIDPNTKYNCRHCDKHLKYKQSRWVHENKCKNKTSYNKLQENVKILTDKVYQLENKHIFETDSESIPSDDEVNTEKLKKFRKMFLPKLTNSDSDTDSDDKEKIVIIIKGISYILENNDLYIKNSDNSKGKFYGTYINGKVTRSFEL